MYSVRIQYGQMRSVSTWHRAAVGVFLPSGGVEDARSSGAGVNGILGVGALVPFPGLDAPQFHEMAGELDGLHVRRRTAGLHVLLVFVAGGRR